MPEKTDFRLAGLAGEFQFCADASWRGFPVSPTPGQRGYDVLVETDHGIVKVQVKISRAPAKLLQKWKSRRYHINMSKAGTKDFHVLACFLVQDHEWVFFRSADVPRYGQMTFRSPKTYRTRPKRGDSLIKMVGWEIFSSPIRPDKTQPLPEAA